MCCNSLNSKSLTIFSNSNGKEERRTAFYVDPNNNLLNAVDSKFEQ